MSQLQKLYEEFKEKKSDGFDFQQDIYAAYKKSDKSDEIKKEILSIVYETLKNKTTDNLWRCIFEADKKMYQQIELTVAKVDAERSLARFLSEPNPILLKGEASLAYTIIDKCSPKIKSEIEQVWLDTFKTVPDFKIKLDAEKQYWINLREEINEEQADYYQKIKEAKELPIVETYQICVPAKLNQEPSFWATSEVDELIKDIVDDFNSFSLEGYMGELGKKCSQSKAEFHNVFVFQFHCHTKLSEDEIKTFRTELLGQLSDGWGENATGRQVLIGDKEVSIDFDTENAFETMVLPPPTDHKKFKMS